MFRGRKMQNNNNEGITILGCGGHAKVIKSIIESFSTYSISFSGRVKVKDMVNYLPDMEIEPGQSYIVGFGALNNIQKRDGVFNRVALSGGRMATIISPHAIVSPDAKIGKGTVVMPRAVIGPGVRVGENCIINTGAIIEHDTVVGRNCHISTGSIVNGNCSIFKNVLIGSGAIVKQGTVIFENNIIGAGAVVVKSIHGEGDVYVGVPAIKK